MSNVNVGSKNRKRVEWLDIFKGMMIILVVVGHATGLFNQYIYQFHMAAFFYIAGYTSKIKEKGICRVVHDKFYTLFLPMCTVIFLGSLLNCFLQAIGLYDFFFSNEFRNLSFTMYKFISIGEINIQFLGVCWFIITLLGIFIFQSIIVKFDLGNKYVSYLLFSSFFYLLGFYLIRGRNAYKIGFFSADLICIGQLFFALGYVAKKIDDERSIVMTQNNLILSLVRLIINVTILYYMGIYQNATVDYPSRSFCNPLIYCIAAINGTLFIQNLSKLIVRIPLKFRNWLTVLGQCSIGILFFHLFFFKIVFFVFYKCDIITGTELRETVAPALIGNKYWLLISIIALLGSVLVWKALCLIPWLSFLLGKNKKQYELIYDWVIELRAVKWLVKFKSAIQKSIKSIRNALYSFLAVEDKKLIICSLAIVILAIIPLYKQGIMCNDELQSRFWSMQGTKAFFERYMVDHVEKGRALSAPLVTFTMWLGFWGSSNWSFRIVQILSILICVCLFGVLINKLFNNTRFAYFCALFSLLFMPVSFEHTSPNAFNALYNFWLAVFLVSIILYADYLQKNDKKRLILSMILLFTACASYEAFVTLIPVYAILALRDQKEIVGCIKKSIIPVCVGVCYLISYYIFKVVFPSNYMGNQIKQINLVNSLNIIKKLVFAEMPGYYLFSPKYKYLFNLYYEWSLENSLRVVLVAGLFFYIVYFSQKEIMIENNKVPLCKLCITSLCCLGVAVLPTIPISIASMYQDSIGEDGFMALPITIIGFYALVLLFCFLIWQIFKREKSGVFKILVVCVITGVLIPIQMMNSTFADVQQDDFQNLENIESLLSSDMMKQFSGKSFYSEDLYKQRNALYIQDGYWTAYIASKGGKVVIQNAPGSMKDDHIYQIDSDKFVLWMNDCFVVASKDSINKKIAVPENFGEKYITANCNNATLDPSGWYFYAFQDNKGEIDEIDLQQITIGSDLTTCRKVYGYYEDGWIEQASRFKLKTGEKGEILINLYNPQEIQGDEVVSFYIDDVLVEEVTLKSNMEEILLHCDRNVIIDLKIETNFLQDNTGGDLRNLSVILSKLDGM